MLNSSLFLFIRFSKGKGVKEEGARRMKGDAEGSDRKSRDTHELSRSGPVSFPSCSEEWPAVREG